MEATHKSILKKKRLVLAKEMVCDEVLQILVEKEVLNDYMVENICSKPTTFHKNVELLTLLPRRGPFAFQHFISALRSSDQSHLADSLQPDFQITPKCDMVHRNTSELASQSSQICLSPESGREQSIKYSEFSLSPSPSTRNINSNPVPSTGLDTSPESAMEFQSICSTSKRPVELHSTDIVDYPVATKRRRMMESNSSEISMEIVPSPYDPLADILSSASESLLLSASKLTLPKSNSAVRNNSLSLHSLIQSSGNSSSQCHLSACDLADGPTREDLIVRRSRQQFQQEHVMDCYEMTSNPRGLALIISVDQFEPSACLDNRLASDVDRARLEFVLRQLGFKCYLLVDGTAREIWTVLEKFASLEDHEHCDVSMVVVMSHGEEGCFFGRDGGRVSIDNVLDLFSNEKCKALQNKPKEITQDSCHRENHQPTRSQGRPVAFDAVIAKEKDIMKGTRLHCVEAIKMTKELRATTKKTFQECMEAGKILLFQSCRGENPDKGVDEADGPTPEKDLANRIKPPESDVLSRSSSRSSIGRMTMRNKLPSHSDCLVGYATVKGYAAMRNTKYGSWFIQALVRVLAYHACDKHVLEIMTMVNNLVKGREGWSPASDFHRCKEMSIFHTTLCKKLFLFPGL